MNLRQKRKHFNYSYRHYVAWFATHTKDFPIPCTKKDRKALKGKLRINSRYDYYDCCDEFFAPDYDGELPKFMRERR